MYNAKYPQEVWVIPQWDKTSSLAWTTLDMNMSWCELWSQGFERGLHSLQGVLPKLWDSMTHSNIFNLKIEIKIEIKSVITSGLSTWITHNFLMEICIVKQHTYMIYYQRSYFPTIDSNFVYDFQYKIITRNSGTYGSLILAKAEGVRGPSSHLSIMFFLTLN